ncbi:hypothetical protein [Glycomyces xiaoerkulensis]|uniref:hypothetical protein n=1 Tax=Glycomyces xiaoerkulensis TaxID=2038139 RepID=UPI0012FFE536|nr:hypothetical protein [Glycomyces xiaoerkulensis]
MLKRLIPTGLPKRERPGAPRRIAMRVAAVTAALAAAFGVQVMVAPSAQAAPSCYFNFDLPSTNSSGTVYATAQVNCPGSGLVTATADVHLFRDGTHVDSGSAYSGLGFASAIAFEQNCQSGDYHARVSGSASGEGIPQYWNYTTPTVSITC